MLEVGELLLARFCFLRFSVRANPASTIFQFNLTQKIVVAFTFDIIQGIVLKSSMGVVNERRCN